MLAEFAKNDPDGNPMETAYRRTVYCCEELKQDGEKISGRYCGYRWCPVCASIRTARAWLRYEPIISGWKRAYMVTLTRRNVTRAELHREVRDYFADLTRAKDGMKRTDRVPLVALRKFECTHNAERDDFHPHFHLIVQSRQMARLLVARWLEICGDRADVKAQDVRPVTKGALAELLKYFTKLMTKTKFAQPAALDAIFRAIKRRRVYQPIGFQGVAVDDDEDELELDEATRAPSRVTAPVIWEWSQVLSDWIDYVTGECLADYTPGSRFRSFVDGIASA